MNNKDNRMIINECISDIQRALELDDDVDRYIYDKTIEILKHA